MKLKYGRLDVTTDLRRGNAGRYEDLGAPPDPVQRVAAEGNDPPNAPQQAPPDHPLPRPGGQPRSYGPAASDSAPSAQADVRPSQSRSSTAPRGPPANTSRRASNNTPQKLETKRARVDTQAIVPSPVSPPPTIPEDTF